MRRTIPAVLITFLFVLSVSLTANAQSFNLLADASQLDDGNGNSDFQCVVEPSTGPLIGFNEGAEAIVTYDASTSTLGTLRSQADLQSDLATTGIDACDAVTFDEGTGIVYFSLRDTNNETFVYSIAADGAASSIAFTPVNGANSLGIDGGPLYVGIEGQFGDVDNGLYTIPTPLSSTASPTAVLNDATIADITMDGTIDLLSSGDVVIMTNEGPFGSAAEPNKIFQVSDPSGSPSISEIADPIASGPLSDGGLLHMEVSFFEGADRIVVSNNSFGAADGEEYAVIQADGSVEVLFTAADIEAETGISDFAPMEDGGFAVDDAGNIVAASVQGGSFGTAALVGISGVPLPVELASFDGQFTGSSIALTWQTLSEKSNAGFEIQHMAPSASSFSGVGFVEGNGTTNQASDYRFVLNSTQPGTHTFRLMQVDVDGEETLHAPITVQVTGDPVSLTGPNPATPGDRVDVSVQVESTQQVDVAVYNLLGQKVATVYDGPISGSSTLNKSLDLSSFTSGVYFVRVIGETLSATERLSVVR
jgi:hypothetical protein